MPLKFARSKFRYCAAAGVVVRHYLGNAFARPDALRLMHEAQGWRFSARINEIGSNLFQLRSEPGFREICRRLREAGDVASAHCELASAMKLKQRGFDIHARRETQVKGQDFDFWAVRGSTRANCEVTFLRGETFTRQSVLNALKRKRGQVPTGTPAIIDCYWPAERWAENEPERLTGELADIAQEFFRGTGRINYILFSREQYVTKPGGGAIVISTQICWHENPREIAPDLDARMRVVPDPHDEIVDRIEGRSARTRGFGEYEDWVDQVLGPCARVG